MSQSIILFDMDGVLLEQVGYHTALTAAVKRIGAALGMPNAAITPAEIGRFEAMSVTNEWDSQSICAALMLIDLWKVDGTVRYEGVAPRASIVTENAPDISAFLDRFTEIGDDPGPPGLPNFDYGKSLVERRPAELSGIDPVQHARYLHLPPAAGLSRDCPGQQDLSGPLRVDPAPEC